MPLRLIVPVLAALALAARPVAAAEGVSRPVVMLDVPFVAQGEDLCGGAAVAMVLRYWGAADVQAEDFAPLVEPGRGGITTGALVRAVTARGWRAAPFRATAESVRDHLARGRPVLGLIRVPGGRHHYVVFVAWANGRVLLHDPALGPFRVRSEQELLAAWEETEGWALLILPLARAVASEARGADAPQPRDREPAAVPGRACRPLVTTATDLAGRGEWGEAAAEMEAAVDLCPGDAQPLRELAGIRFHQERWSEAAAVAARAAAADPGDGFAWRLLGASRFLAGDAHGALVAWNRVGEPRLDRLQVDGLERTRVEVLKASLDLAPRALLRPGSVERARRRLGELPTISSWRLAVEPLGGGRADLRAAVVERPLLDPIRTWLTRAVVDAVTGRELRVRAASPTRGGEAVGAGIRWWSGRPAAWITASEPGALGLPGVATLSGLWEDQTYAMPGVSAPAATAVRERRRRASLSVADWSSPALRVGVGVALDWFAEGMPSRTRETYGAAAVSLERRAASDRLALLGDAAVWRGQGPAFHVTGLRAVGRSSPEPRRIVVRATAGIEAASRSAPFALWPGAGTGTGRPFLLRAHPLLKDGSVGGEGFGRILLHGGIEVETRARQAGPFAIGAAAFVDAARACSRLAAPGWGRALADAGLGLRLRTSSTGGGVRIDLATPLGSSRWRLSAAWVSRWPGRL